MRERLRTLTDRLRLAVHAREHATVQQCRAMLRVQMRGWRAERAYEALADAHAACLTHGEHDAADVLLGILRERPPAGGPWLVVALAQALGLDDDEGRLDELERLATGSGPWLDVRRDVYADALLRLERVARSEHRLERAATYRHRLARLANEPDATPHQRLIAARSRRDCE